MSCARFLFGFLYLSNACYSVHGERKPLLEDYYTSPPPGTTNPALQPKSAAALRNRFLSKLGGPVSYIINLDIFPILLCVVWTRSF